MKSLFTVIALSVAAAVAAPAFAQTADPKTQAECEKKDGMRWDATSQKCLPK